jgi:pullulanase
MSVQQEYDKKVHYGDYEVTGGLSVFSKQFDDAYYYEGDDLGVAFDLKHTLFKLWAPTACAGYYGCGLVFCGML